MGFVRYGERTKFLIALAIQAGVDFGAVRRSLERGKIGGVVLELRLVGDAMRARPARAPFRIGHDQSDEMRPAVAIDHRLGDLGLEREQAFDPLRRDILALVVDDDVLLAVGDHQPAGIVDPADVAGAQPAVGQGHRAVLGALPIAVHDILAAHEDFAVRGDAQLGIGERRPDGGDRDPGPRPVARDHRPGLGLAIALQYGHPHELEEAADLGRQRRAARHHRLQRAAEALADRRGDGPRDQHPAEPVAGPRRLARGERERLARHPARRPPALGQVA